MHHTHLPIFSGLSILVAILGSWTALDLFERVRGRPDRSRYIWLAVTAFAMGVSIWSMHFIAMLGFDPGSPVSYDPGLTLLSLLLAIGGTAGAFLLASGGSQVWRLAVAGIAMGLSICLMHYVGMAALRSAVSLGYRPDLVALSLLVAISAATAALWAASRQRTLSWRTVAAGVLGVAIVGMHYTAMAAVILRPAADGMAPVPGAPPVILAVAIAAGTIVLLFTALAASLYDQRHALVETLDAGGVGYWEAGIQDGGAMYASRRARVILGLDPDIPITETSFRSALSPASVEERERARAASLKEGRDYHVEYELADGRWISVRGRPVRDRAGRARKMAGVVLDITETRSTLKSLEDSREQQRLLINELNHRVKNNLATIQAVARLTAKRAQSVPDFIASFEARLLAMASTHSLLTATSWEKADVRSLLANELTPYAPDQVNLEGPEAWVAAEQALALGMIFHELATNAAKYGALSTPDGCVTVTWRQTESELALDWTEEKGPPVVRAPEPSGFGSQLIALSARKLRGDYQIDYASKALCFRLRMPTGASDAEADRD